MFPKLAAMGAAAITLSVPLLVEQVARRSPVGAQFIRWLREDGADPRRMSLYPALRRWILENGTVLTERDLGELREAVPGPMPMLGPGPGGPAMSPGSQPAAGPGGPPAAAVGPR